MPGGVGAALGEGQGLGFVSTALGEQRGQVSVSCSVALMMKNSLILHLSLKKWGLWPWN